MMAAVLRAAGEPTGLHTSPHLHHFTERVVAGDEAISEDDFSRLMCELTPQIEAEDEDGSYGSISTFEALVALTFLYFREQGVTSQVLEVGMGGRLDATNVFERKEVCVITPISLEHTAVLGNTIAEIAEEKAAIISPGTTVVMGPQRESAADVVRRVCAERGASLLEVAGECAMKRGRAGDDGQEFTLRTPRATYRLRLPVLGRHQLDNAATAVLALEAFAEQSDIDIGEQAIREGLANVRLPARIEVLRRKPLIVADGAHNRDSARALVRTVREELGRADAVLVIGCSGDKDPGVLAEELAPFATQAIVTRSRHPRSMAPGDIVRAFAEREVPAMIQEPVGVALDTALALAGSDGAGAVVACGSLFVAAEAREHVLGVAYDPLPGRERRQESEVGA